ncbi:hypothetical protein NU688_32730 [Variovorax sp. ZS18.2.2]|uniref:hypothetical protein n=1 Tax=Variovorax sp. ZS18.2.2 TaxID=2971255 RepID=UPI002150D5D6|nr:hypothetical protein [Variovorax sp. ZS18.2.2]MCR6480962.1 hypothetical protein [Variovorax sp. ZS18.2.2]
MRELAETSKSVAGLAMYLTVHQRASSGYVFLRWRARAAGGNRHLPAEEVQKLIAGYSIEHRRWLLEVDAEASRLNERHLRGRDVIRELRNQVARSKPHLHARQAKD